ncbi:MAG TPA: flagellar basal body rod protein FlgB [Calditrichia bacterium]|nr:flagellar basal body rod protein FlgB [Calditrichota bacterium]HQV32992.1 flagellar basal body rod protein FlgB [Calditrichia bacterium]
MKIFETDKLNLVKQAMGVYTRQHQAIAKNIANANNEEYKRTNTDFSEELQKAHGRHLRTSDERHFPVSAIPDPEDRSKDGGVVDVTQEMSQLADNQIRFEFGARVLRKTFTGLKSAIAGRMAQ